MATRERRTERGGTRARRAIIEIGREIRETRVGAGVSQREAAASVGISHSTYGRIERGALVHATVLELSLASAAVGLDLGVRAFPNADPLRDRGHVALLERFRARLAGAASWRTEVPLPGPGELRSWDAVLTIAPTRLAIEAETRLGDLQALLRRIELKRRDGGIELVILLVADTRHDRSVLRAHRELLRSAFPLDTRAVLGALAAGRAPSAGGIVVL